MGEFQSEAILSTLAPELTVMGNHNAYWTGEVLKNYMELFSLNIHNTVILHSPSLRTKQIAQSVQNVFGGNVPMGRFDNLQTHLNPDKGRQYLLDALQYVISRRGNTNHYIVIGHSKTFTDFFQCDPIRYNTLSHFGVTGHAICHLNEQQQFDHLDVQLCFSTSLQQPTITDEQLLNHEFLNFENVPLGLSTVYFTKSENQIMVWNLRQRYGMEKKQEILENLQHNDIKVKLTNNEIRTFPLLENVDLSSKEIKEILFIPANNNIRFLYLSDNRLTNLPESIGKMTKLKTLTLHDNQLTQVSDSSINGLIGLKRVNLSYNALTQLPKNIGNLTALEDMDLNHNHLKQLPESVTALTGLKELDLHHNLLTQLPENIGNMTGLKKLDLSDNKLTQFPESVTALTGLERLDLSRNQLTQLSENIGNMTGLKKLYLSYNNQLTQLPESINRLTLEEFKLDNTDIDNQKFRVNVIKVINNAEEIEEEKTFKSSGYTDLSSKNITEILFIPEITFLSVLNLSNNKLIQLPNTISVLTGLRDVYLSNNKLIQLPDTISALTGLKKLDLSNNQLIKLPDTISVLTGLTELDLSNNKLIKLPDNIGGMTGLTKLALNDNQLKQVPDTISSLTGLKELDLGHNQLTQLPDTISALIGLKALYLNNNKLKQVPETISALTGLNELDLSNNQLTQFPENILSLTQLERLGLQSNELTQLPENIGNMTGLKILILNVNQLTQLPESITTLTGLEQLSLQSNELTLLPENIGNMTELNILDLHGNELIQVPDSLSRLRNLKLLDLNNNQLTELPESVLQMTNQLTRYYGDHLHETIDDIKDSILCLLRNPTDTNRRKNTGNYLYKAIKYDLYEMIKILIYCEAKTDLPIIQAILASKEDPVVEKIVNLFHAEESIFEGVEIEGSHRDTNPQTGQENLPCQVILHIENPTPQIYCLHTYYVYNFLFQISCSNPELYYRAIPNLVRIGSFLTRHNIRFQTIPNEDVLVNNISYVNNYDAFAKYIGQQLHDENNINKTLNNLIEQGSGIGRMENRKIQVYKLKHFYVKIEKEQLTQLKALLEANTPFHIYTMLDQPMRLVKERFGDKYLVSATHGQDIETVYKITKIKLHQQPVPVTIGTGTGGKRKGKKSQKLKRILNNGRKGNPVFSPLTTLTKKKNGKRIKMKRETYKNKKIEYKQKQNKFIV